MSQQDVFLSEHVAYRDAQLHGVYRLSEGQRLWVLSVERLQGGHQSLA